MENAHYTALDGVLLFTDRGGRAAIMRKTDPVSAEEFQFLYSDDERSSEELCIALGEALGLDQPAPVAIMRRALIDRTFVFNLINCRGDSTLLGVLFSDPRNRQYEADPDVERSGPRPPSSGGTAALPDVPSSLTLALKAGQAAARWGGAGFARVDPEVFDARFGICQRCEYLVDPPDRAVYKVKLRRQSDPRVCAACGCVASRKASLPTENCPVADSTDPAVSRWGEPIR
jgi:hypothetical protein